LLPIIAIAIATRKLDYHPTVIITRPTAQGFPSVYISWSRMGGFYFAQTIFNKKVTKWWILKALHPVKPY